MSNILIIAPTKDYYRDPAQKEINDVIKDQTDAINLKEKTIEIVPETARKAPDNTELKRYHDMRAIHIGNEKADRDARQFEENRERNKRKNGVFYSVTDDSANNRYISIAYRHR